MRQIADVIRSKIVVEIGVFYYRCPFVTLGDLECRWFESGRQTEIEQNRYAMACQGCGAVLL